MPARPAIASKSAAAPLRRPNRRGRPTKAQAAAIEDTILQAAFKAFVESGYDAATMEGIAERGGVSKGTLYGRFPDKETLFRAVLQDRIERWSGLCGAEDHLLPSDMGARLKVHARTLQKMLEWPEYLQITKLIRSAAGVNFPEIAAYWSEVGTDRFVRFLAADMASVAGDSDRSGSDWTYLAQMFLFTFSGWYQSRTTHGPVDPAEVSSFIEQLVDAILTMVAAARN